MGIVVDTAGQIYKKLDAVNATLAAVGRDDDKILAAAQAAQITITGILQEIEAAEAEEMATITQKFSTLAETLSVIADQVAALYKFILQSPQTIGFDTTTVTSSPQPTPSKPGP
jgi:propanediol dehydratase large subunit